MAEIKTADYGAGPEMTPEENRAALQRAIEACKEAGGGVVVLAAGEYQAVTPPEAVTLIGSTDNP